MTKSKQKLLELEKEGKYLFHGSPVADLKELKPHQAYTVPKGEKDMVKDDEPSVVATPYLEIAIFRALTSKSRSSFSVSATSVENVKIKFAASEETIKAAKDKIGYVYVLNREGFIPRSGHTYCMEWRSLNSVKPLWVFKVGYEDLLKNIEIIKQ